MKYRIKPLMSNKESVINLLHIIYNQNIPMYSQ